MNAAQLNITIKKYATFKLALQIKNGTGDNTTPAPLDGITPRLQIRSSVNAAEVLLDMSVENGRIQIVDAAQGQILLRIERPDTAAIGWETGVYDLLLVDAAGEGKRVLEGVVDVSPGVTRV